MFNVLFHGAVSLATDENNRNDFLKDRKAHAKNVLFPYGFFVDPILGGSFDDTKNFRIVNTSRKYYATNMAPSGAKAYINFDPIEEKTVKEKEKEVVEVDVKFNNMKSSFDSVFETENWITSDVSSIEDLIKEAKKYIKDNLKIDFGESSTINNLE
jgi:hypothetical protein